MDTVEYRLTTIDNPYDPFTEFNKWYMYDVDNKYFTCSYLARMANTADGLTDEQNQELINNAIDEIIKNDSLHLYKKVKRN